MGKCERFSYQGLGMAATRRHRAKTTAQRRMRNLHFILTF